MIADGITQVYGEYTSKKKKRTTRRRLIITTVIDYQAIVNYENEKNTRRWRTKRGRQGGVGCVLLLLVAAAD